MTRQPRLLNASLAEVRRLNGVSLAIDLTTEDLPKATLVLPATEDRLAMRDLLELYTPRGSAGIFRVVSLAEDIRDRQTVQLMGAADTLADDVYPQAASEDVSKTASAWITDILSKQTTARWQAGTCALSKTVKIRPNYQNLWSLLETVREAEPGYWWTFDFTTTPWTLSLAALPTATACGVRLSRNIESMSISATDQEMCNRLIVSYTPTSGSQTVTTYNNTASQTVYGIIVKTADIKQDELPAGTTVEQYAQRILAERAQPVVSVSISGVDLYRLTGDDYDKIQLGTLCSAVIEGYGAMTERVVALSWPDALGEPDRVRFSLSNALSPFTENMSILKATAKGLAGMGAAAKEDLDKWSKVVTDRLEAVDGTGVTQMWQSGIEMDAHTGVRIYSLEQGITSLYGGIEVASDHITSTVRATGLVWDEDTQQYVLDPNAAQGSLYNLTSQIRQTADSIEAEVKAARGSSTSLSSALQLKADSATLISQINNSSESTPIAYGKVQVQPGHILIKAINGGGQASDVTIEADKINLTGYVTARQMETAIASIAHITPTEGTLTVTGSVDVGGTLGTGALNIESWGGFQIDGTSAGLGSGICGFGTPTESGGQISIPYYSFDELHDGTIDFDIAATQTYRAGVAAVTVDSYSALAPATSTGASMSSTVTLTNSNTDTITITGGISGRNTSTVTAPVYSTSTGNYSYYPYVTLNGGSRAYLRQASFSGSAAREDGWNGAAGTVVTPTAAGTGAYIDITYPVTYSSSSGTNTGTRRYTLEADQSAGYTYLTTGSGISKKNVARVAIPSSSKSISSVTAATPTYASNVYTVPLDVTYDDGTTERAYVTLNFSISNWQSGGTYGTYTINLNGNTARTLSPSGAYGAGQNSVTLQSLKHLKTVYSGSIQTQYKLSNGKQSTMSSSAVTQFDP